MAQGREHNQTLCAEDAGDSSSGVLMISSSGSSVSVRAKRSPHDGELLNGKVFARIGFKQLAGGVVYKYGRAAGVTFARTVSFVAASVGISDSPGVLVALEVADRRIDRGLLVFVASRPSVNASSVTILPPASLSAGTPVSWPETVKRSEDTSAGEEKEACLNKDSRDLGVCDVEEMASDFALPK